MAGSIEDEGFMVARALPCRYSYAFRLSAQGSAYDTVQLLAKHAKRGRPYLCDRVEALGHKISMPVAPGVPGCQLSAGRANI